MTSSLLQSSSTTTTFTPQPKTFPSFWTLVRYLAWNSNWTSNDYMWSPSMSSKRGWKMLWKKPRQLWLNPKMTWQNTTIGEGPQLQITNLETRFTWMPATSKPPGLHRNSPTGGWAPLPSSEKSEMVDTNFVFPPPWVDFIPSSMSSSWHPCWMTQY